MNAVDMGVWSPEDEEATTYPPPANPDRTDDLRRLLPKAAERLTEAARALSVLDDQLEEHLKHLDRVRLAAERRSAAFAITVAFEATLEVLAEAERLGLTGDVDEYQLSDAPLVLARYEARTSEGLQEHAIWERVARLKAMAASMRAWGEEFAR